MTIRKGFIAENLSWQPLKNIKAEPEKCLSMRPHQLEIFNNFYDSRLSIIGLPSGAGKSATVKFNFTKRLMDNPNLKILITVPINMINSFDPNDLMYPDGIKREWRIDPINDLSRDGEEFKIDKVIEFLETKKFPKGIHERIMKCSQAALIGAYKKADKISWANTIVIVDEAHHVQGSGEDELSSNEIGNVVRSILKNKSKDRWLWFLSATFFRGDGVEILSKTDHEKFKTYFLPMDKYFQTLKYLKSFSYDFFPYKGTFPEIEIQQLLKNKKNHKKTIIYVPRVDRLWTGRCKVATVNRLKKTIHKVWKDAKIWDLVSEDDRDSRKQHLLKNKYKSDIDIVLTVDLMNEGVDWPEAQQSLDLAPSLSLTRASQRVGRLLRDVPGKKHVSYYVFFPFTLNLSDEENCRKKLSENFATLSASFMIEESLIPVRLPANKKTGDTKKTPREPKENQFTKIVKDENDRNEIRQEIFNDIIKIKAEAEGNDQEVSRENYRNTIKSVLDRHNVTQKVEIISEIETELTRRAIPSLGVDLSWMVDRGFDKIRWDKITECLSIAISGKCGSKTWKEFREHYEQRRKTLEEQVKIAEQLAKENNGILPYKAWLGKNGYSSLIHAMYECPKSFNHIKQEKMIKSLEEQVKIAERLSKKNNGILPCGAWLIKNRYSGLNYALRKYPESFSHIKQEKMRKTLEEQVKEAGQLAKENNGILPCGAWLRKNGYNGLNIVIRRHPEAFKGMKQEYKGKIKIL